MGFDGRDTENENIDYTVIRFDAWKNDFWNNAFEIFVASIMGQDIFSSTLLEPVLYAKGSA